VPCEDPAALAAALCRVASDVSLRGRLSALAPLATAKYALDRVVAHWEELLLTSGAVG
jgi:hypothetical protein